MTEAKDMLKPLAAEAMPRPRHLQPWQPPPMSRIHGWVSSLATEGPALLTVAAPIPAYRAEVFDWFFTSTTWNVLGTQTTAPVWLSTGPLKTFTHQTKSLGKEPWGLLWALLDVQDFVVEEPLRQLIDQGFRFTYFFKALWETRFLLAEGNRFAEKVVHALTTWMIGGPLRSEDMDLLQKAHISRELVSPQERLDMHLFLLALAHQNGLADRTVFIFDGLDEALRLSTPKRRAALRELLEMAMAFERWRQLGSAAGLVLGTNNLGDLERHNAKLFERVKASLV